MIIDGQNNLKKPEILTVDSFENTLASFKQVVIDHISETDPVQAAQVAATFENESELSTKIIEACTIVLTNVVRDHNETLAQNYAPWAKGDALDAVAANLSLERQQVDPGDPEAFPPVPPTMEEDEHLLQRYYLAPYSFSNAGPKLAYKFHAMTLDERPVISVEAPEAGKVVVTYIFAPTSFAGQVKDAIGEKTEPGKVDVRILSREGDGALSPHLKASVEAYFSRDDVSPDTDEITVTGVDNVNYSIDMNVTLAAGPDTAIIQAELQSVLQKYTDDQHRIAGEVLKTKLDQIAHNAGAVEVVVNQPSEPVKATSSQAPYCTGINVTVTTQ